MTLGGCVQCPATKETYDSSALSPCIKGWRCAIIIEQLMQVAVVY